MAVAELISSLPTDEARYDAEKDHNAGEPETSSSRSAVQELDTVAEPKGQPPGSPVRPVTGIKVCSGWCLSQNPRRPSVR